MTSEKMRNLNILPHMSFSPKVSGFIAGLMVFIRGIDLVDVGKDLIDQRDYLCLIIIIALCFCKFFADIDKFILK